MVIIMWIVFSIIVGAIGSGRNIGFWGALFLSLLLSEKVLTVQEKQQEALDKISKAEKEKNTSIADELEKIRKMKDEGVIDDNEFQTLKRKIINS